MKLSIEAQRLLTHLEKMVRRKANGDRIPPSLHKLVTHSWTNTKLSRDAGIDVDHLQRARAELVSAGYIYEPAPLMYEQGRRKRTRPRQARHSYTLRIRKFGKYSRAV